MCVHVQAAQVVLIALFELNTPEFTMLLGALPKTFQDGTTKLLHNHLRNASANSGIGMVTHTLRTLVDKVHSLALSWFSAAALKRDKFRGII